MNFFYFSMKRLALSFFIVLTIQSMERSCIPQTEHIVADSVDELVIKGIKHIKEHGEEFKARAGSGQQAYDVQYTLTDSHNRVHSLRQPVAVKYLCRELLAYFKGSLNVNEGLAQAASFWKSLADEKGNIASNYGYYVFHQRVPEYHNKTQYAWVIDSLLKNKDSRKAFININQPFHKQADAKDFPCTLGMQFFIRDNHVCSSVSSRSTDVYTGLPYDMAFFSFVNELVYKDLNERYKQQKEDGLKLGYTSMKTNFTQIYDKTRLPVLTLLDKAKDYDDRNTIVMPFINDAQATLTDIYHQTTTTPVIQWINDHAEFKKSNSGAHSA